MTSSDQEKAGRTPDEDLRSILRQLTPEQKRFIRWRPWYNSNTKAAKKAKVPIDTVNGWRKRGIPIDRAVELLGDDGVVMADEMLQDAVVEAAEVKVGGLRSRDERIRQAASSEILDRKVGKPLQKQEISTDGDVTIRVVYGPDGKAEGTA